MTIYAIDGVVPVVHPTTFIHPTASVIGDVVIGPRCYIGPGASVRGDFGRIRIGEGCNVQDTCVIHAFPGNAAVVEDWGHVGHGSVVHGCTVGRNALIGMNAVLMDGVVIGEASFIAALAFVKAGTEIPPRSLAAGSPARVVRPVTDDEIAWKEEGTKRYQDLAARCLESLEEVAPLTEIDADRPALNITPLDPLYKTKQKASG